MSPLPTVANTEKSKQPETNNDSLLADVFPKYQKAGRVQNSSTSTNTATDRTTPRNHKKRIHNDETTTFVTANIFNDPTAPFITKPKRKRKKFSCDNCRKLKTKCVNDGLSSICERCKRLNIECNLPSQRKRKADGEEEEIGNEQAEESIVNNETTDTIHSLDKISIDKRLDKVENSISAIDNKLNQLISLQQQQLKLSIQPTQLQSQSQSQVHTLQSTSIQLPQLLQHRRDSHNSSAISNQEEVTSPAFKLDNVTELINKIPVRVDFTSPVLYFSKIRTELLGNQAENKFKKATEKFINFFLEHEILCLELSKSFLEYSHYFIIPGGISVIDKDYVLEHPLIACVFVFIAMSISKKFNNTDIKNNILGLLKDILSTIMNKFELLTDHDIEALVYICMYNICGVRPRYLITLTLMHFLSSVDTKNLVERVCKENVYLDDDLYHLRILNSLTAIYLEQVIGMGAPMMFPNFVFDINGITVTFPNATIGDAIEVARLEVLKFITDCINNVKFFTKDNFFNMIYQAQDGNKIFQLDYLYQWKEKWKKILLKDISKVGSYVYNFAYIVLSRKYIASNPNDSKENLQIIIATASHYSFELLKTFIDFKKEYLRGTPSYQLGQCVYACITLLESLNNLLVEERKKALDMISKAYWNLSKLGLEMSDATGMIAEIIRKLIEVANKNQILKINTTQQKGFVGSGSIKRNEMYSKRKNSQQQTKLSPEDLPVSMKNEISNKSSPNSSMSNVTPINYNNNFSGIPTNNIKFYAANDIQNNHSRPNSTPISVANQPTSIINKQASVNNCQLESNVSNGNEYFQSKTNTIDELSPYQYNFKGGNTWPTFSELRTTSTNSNSQVLEVDNSTRTGGSIINTSLANNNHNNNGYPGPTHNSNVIESPFPGFTGSGSAFDQLLQFTPNGTYVNGPGETVIKLPDVSLFNDYNDYLDFLNDLTNNPQ